MLTTDLKRSLVQSATYAAQFAYAPYSKFTVGAALLTTDYQIYTGCNVENAAYGLCNCAERTALFKAISEGNTQFVAIAIVAPKLAPPCGACRQALAEFCGKNFDVICADLEGNIGLETTLGTLLPESFTLHD